MPASPPLLLTNAHLLCPDSGLDGPGGVLIADERIVAAGPNVRESAGPEGTRTIDCKGKHLTPGLIDMRVQLRDPGREHEENLDSGTMAAAAGGITSIVCLPNTEPVMDDMSLIEFIGREARKIGRVKVYAYGAATRRLKGEELAEMGLMSSVGALGFTDGEKAIASARMMRLALSYAAGFGKPIVQHPEEPSLSHPGGMNEGEFATRLGLPGIPAAAEVIMAERDIRLAALTGGHLHLAHLSTAAAVDAVRKAKAEGIRVTCDTAPHYFALNETAVGDYRTFAKVTPPLRSEDDRQAIIDGLADGTIDAVASDHSPHDPDMKRLPFAAASAGVVGLETLLPITLTLVHQNRLPLVRAVEVLTTGPRRVLGLEEGSLAKGGPGDVTVVDIDKPWRVDAQAFRSRSKNSAFDKLPVQGRADLTVVNGRIIHQA
ncbi:MAG: dihydroorotase [Alphaproteobacteria bacterium]|nr:dihydroorotase [Alphaproteobacteria bacterium]